MTLTIRCDENAGDTRLDVLISERVPELTRSAAQRIIENGGVTLRGVPVRKNHRAAAGDIFELTLPEPTDTKTSPQDIPLDIVYEDGDVIVINKPRGMVVHPAPGHPDGTLVNALLAHCMGSLSGIGGERRPGIVHRLDKDTSGLVIAAKNDFAHLSLSSQLAARTLKRVYEAVVHGVVKNDTGTIDAPVGRHPADRKRQAVTDKGRGAVTHYEVITRYRGFTHVRCRLETGRTHQIRVHMAHIGHPLVGDLVYGHKKAERGLAGQCLHARALAFKHPRTGDAVSVESGLPEYFSEILERLPPY